MFIVYWSFFFFFNFLEEFKIELIEITYVLVTFFYEPLTIMKKFLFIKQRVLT